MARQTTFEVTLNTINGAKKVKVKVGTTVKQFKLDNGIASASKLIDDEGTLRDSDILTSNEVFVSASKQNG